MKILKNVYDEILKSYVVPPPEQGGILGIKNNTVCEYCHDGNSIITDTAVYVPNVDFLNKKIGEWSECSVEFAGILHSHLSNQVTLSSGDKEYIGLLFDTLPKCTNELYFPIVIPETKEIISFVARRCEKAIVIQSDKIDIIL